MLVPMALALLALTAVASPGMFNIDEFVLFAGAQALASNGAFTVTNGWPQFVSPDLELWLLVTGPNGLTPQYPPGVAVAGAPLLAIFGVRGLVLINVLAGIGTLAALWVLAKRYFGGVRVALIAVLLLVGATFWLEYLYAIWPHAVGVLAVTLALLWLLDCLDRDAELARKATAAGAVLGAGFLFRTDTILALPALGLVAILFARRPFRIGAFFGLGLAPFMLLASAANLAKFGTLNPLSYGNTTPGHTTLSTHLIPMAALALVALVLVGSRFVSWRPGRREYAIGAVAVVLAVVFSATAAALAQRYLSGAWALLVDATTITDPRPGVEPVDGGLLSFWGYWKKALGQSMPWLGVLALLVHAPKDATFRRLLWIVAILCAVWSLPFLMLAWHGGLGANMRYLLPVLPVLCALSAKLLTDLAGSVPHAPRILAAGALAGGAVIVLWIILHPTGVGGAHQILSIWLLAGTIALALLAGLRWRGQPTIRAASLAAAAAGIAASTLFMVADFQQAQRARARTEAMAAAMAALPDDTLIYAPPTYLTGWVFQPGHIAAMPASQGATTDLALIDRALAKGYRVLVWPAFATEPMRTRYGARLAASGVAYPGGEFLEVRP